jgi:hypothetical protein
MKKTILTVLALLALGNPGYARLSNDFDRLKALAGDWEATTPEGKTRVTYRLISNDTALLETIISENMVSVYHPDGDAVLMTHYCAIGNQPRMRAQSSANGDLTFQYVDAANLKSPNDGHMQRLVIKFQDADHVTQEWTWKENGKETTSVSRLQRVK